MTFTESRWTYWKWALTNGLVFLVFGVIPLVSHFAGQDISGWQIGFGACAICIPLFFYIYQRAVYNEYLCIDDARLVLHFRSVQVDLPRDQIANFYEMPVGEGDTQYAVTTKDGRFYKMPARPTLEAFMEEAKHRFQLETVRVSESEFKRLTQEADVLIFRGRETLLSWLALVIICAVLLIGAIVSNVGHYFFWIIYGALILWGFAAVVRRLMYGEYIRIDHHEVTLNFREGRKDFLLSEVEQFVNVGDPEMNHWVVKLRTGVFHEVPDRMEMGNLFREASRRFAIPIANMSRNDYKFYSSPGRMP